MKLPSVNYLMTNAKESFVRFPLTVLSSLISVVVGIYLIENEKDMLNMFPFINLMLCASLGIPLYFCATIISNKRGFVGKSTWIINSFATLLLIAIYFTLPNAESTHNTSLPYIKYALYNITCHLLVSFIPFAFSKQLNAFWHYNKILFIRFLTSVLYSGFICIGLLLALTSLNLLFDLKIHEQLYFEIWIVTMCFFNTWFFVGGIPVDFDKLDSIDEYPKGLRIFSQYVLLPLLGLYLIILYAYGTKIFVLWDWPKGIVSYLIICVSVLGILAFLLLHPYGNQKEHSWIRKVSKGYYFMLFPLLVILFIAIFMRINDYGITISRYAVLVLGIWLSIVCVYTAIGKTNIKFIPTSLAIIAILISFGPWGMFSVSERSQVNRLRSILEQSNLLVGGKIQNETVWIQDSLPELHSISGAKNDGILSDSLHNEVKSILDYLDDHHGFVSIRDWYSQDVDSIVILQEASKTNSYSNREAELYMRTLGLQYNHRSTEIEKASIDFTSGYNNTISTVTGYDYLVEFSLFRIGEDNESNCSFMIDSIEFELAYSGNPKGLLVLKSNTGTINFDIEELVNKLKQQYGDNPESVLPLSEMRLINSNDLFEVKIEFHSIRLTPGKKKSEFTNLEGEIFIKRNNGRDDH